MTSRLKGGNYNWATDIWERSGVACWATSGDVRDIQGGHNEKMYKFFFEVNREV
jgi:hypothetical protein